LTANLPSERVHVQDNGRVHVHVQVQDNVNVDVSVYDLRALR